jgi:hypothetical protein
MSPSVPTPSFTFKQRVIFDQAFGDESVPSLADVKRMERVLSRFRCLAPLSKWRREYAFARNASTLRLDKSLIAFKFETPHGGRHAGRRIVPFARLFGVDDGFFDTAHGVYSIRTHLATLTYCGPNHPPLPKPGR